MNKEQGRQKELQQEEGRKDCNKRKAESFSPRKGRNGFVHGKLKSLAVDRLHGDEYHEHIGIDQRTGLKRILRGSIL